jgi:CheY-like chemotaxis protein
MSFAKILAVDDDPDFEITRMVLEPAGYEVVTANSSAEAVETG